jgi:hypothetical protein
MKNSVMATPSIETLLKERNALYAAAVSAIAELEYYRWLFDLNRIGPTIQDKALNPLKQAVANVVSPPKNQ